MSKERYSLKKQPIQDRSRFTVDVIREAAAHILKEYGIENFTTNRVAERAGVSIGSLYQYFSSKEVLIAEVKREHFFELRQLFEQAYRKNRNQSLEVMARALIDASIEAHLLDLPLHRILSSDLSAFEIKENDHSEESIHELIRKVLEDHKLELRANIDVSIASTILYKVIEETIHDTVIRDSNNMDNQTIADELYILVMSYLS